MNAFEVHVTVSPERISEFSLFCSQLKAKPIFIQLDKGQYREQLMLAASIMLENDALAIEWATNLAAKVRDNFEVIRIKLESRLTEGPFEYYEAHWKLESSDENAFTDLIKLNPRILRSRNLLAGNVQYLSARDYGDDALIAGSYFGRMGTKIKTSGLVIKKVHYERVIWDSNHSIDNGWAN